MCFKRQHRLSLIKFIRNGKILWVSLHIEWVSIMIFVVFENVLLSLFLCYYKPVDHTKFSSGCVPCCPSTIWFRSLCNHHFYIYNLTFRRVQKLVQGYLWCCRHCIVLAMFAWNCNSRVTSPISCKISLPVLFSQWYSDFKRNWEVWESKRQWRRADRNASCFRWSTKIAHVNLFPLYNIISFCKVTYSLG